jgi:hypothetical protein
MAVLLYVIGALAFAVGAIALGFGFEIELSFGNSLIVAGTSAAVGGLIVVGLGAVVSQLQRIAEGQAARLPVRPSRIPEMFEAPGAPRVAAGVPFPPKPRAATPPPVPPLPPPAVEPEPAEVLAEDHFAEPPELANPDVPPLEVEEEVTLSPFESVAPPPAAEVAEPPQPKPRFSFGGLGARRAEPEWPPARPEAPPPEPPPLPRASTTSFDSMWPAPDRKPPADLGKAEPKVEPKPEPSSVLPPERPAKPEAPHGRAGEAHAVAILKSGVVDGMGYTLYVDGSIEAELPQGTLRFNSINELRDYLEKNAQS